MRRVVWGDCKGSVSTTCVGPVIPVICILALVCVLALPFVEHEGSIQQIVAGHSTFGSKNIIDSGSTRSTADLDPISKLIGDIRQAVQVASGGTDISFATKDRQVWEKNFPCKSRGQLEHFYKRRPGVKYIPVSRSWQRVFDEYAILHRVCMSRVGDLKKYVASKNESVGCKFVLVETHFGLGNKFYHMSSLILFAVLTQRVIVIPTSTVVPDVVCEPFLGSSWAIKSSVHDLIKARSNTPKQLYSSIDESISARRPFSTYASDGGGKWAPSMRFWCDTEQVYLKNVTWFTASGCLYHMPKLFAVPMFRPVLEAMFPDRTAFTHVLRTAMLPADHVWNRVLGVQLRYFENVTKQVGLQIRVLHGRAEFEREKVTISKHISRCVLETKIIPNVSNPADSSNVVAAVNDTTTVVFIASLYGTFRDYMKRMYRLNKTVTGEKLAFIQLSQHGNQGRGGDEDTGAFVEVLMLSLSDTLVVTPFSTFGGLAQGYGTQVPYFIEYNMTATDACQRGISKEPCGIGTHSNYQCRYDSYQFSEIGKSVPYLTKCMRIDVGNQPGVLLQTKE